MKFGGIYDQIGGGISRYSTDKNWMIPHFEKMLYDNGQFLSLLSNIYKVTKKKKYKKVIKESINWLRTEMRDDNGGFYSAIDADSDGEEGKFYSWSNEELKKVLGEEYKNAKQIFKIDTDGNWE